MKPVPPRPPRPPRPPAPPLRREALRRILELADSLDEIESSPRPAHRHPAMHEFIGHLHTHGFTQSFDWKAWLAQQPDGWERDPRILLTANLETLRCLWTAHIRLERFSEGHLDQLCKSGYIRRSLSRLKELLDAGEGEP
jgi:hypothetical protein